MKPDGYPLPWNEQLDMPWWKINYGLCIYKPGWAEFQKGMSMAEIIRYLTEEAPSTVSELFSPDIPHE
jgi:hypothetical protein